MRLLILLLFIFFTTNNLLAQVAGCTDPQATNFDSTATSNNGSCNYAPASSSPPLKAQLSSTLKEISGMIYYQQKLLALNDGGGGNKLYVLDTTSGNILQTITIESATNIDWEDLAQDSDYVYIADVGNNAHGNRKDLCIYKVDKSAFANNGDFTIPAASVQKINFNYPDQADFSSAAANATRFDCEAVTVLNGKLHLFTKNWLGNYSVHYALPLSPGSYAAERLDSLNTGGILITAADAGANKELLLTGLFKNVVVRIFSCVWFR